MLPFSPKRPAPCSGAVSAYFACMLRPPLLADCDEALKAYRRCLENPKKSQP